MTRKDTIMIAVFVNAALLIALFVTAIKSENSSSVKESKNIAVTSPISLSEPEKKEIKTAQGDEIDQVLKEFSQKKIITATSPAAEKIDYAKEITAMTKPPSEPKLPISKDYVMITVKKGDVLEKLARAYHSSVDEITQCNHLKTTVLQIGQQLRIPQKRGSSTVGFHSSESGTYIVKQGDNPTSIAIKNNMKVQELLELNNLNEEKARHLKAGDKLRIQKK